MCLFVSATENRPGQDDILYSLWLYFPTLVLKAQFPVVSRLSLSPPSQLLIDCTHLQQVRQGYLDECHEDQGWETLHL